MMNELCYFAARYVMITSEDDNMSSCCLLIPANLPGVLVVFM